MSELHTLRSGQWPTSYHGSRTPRREKARSHDPTAAARSYLRLLVKLVGAYPIIWALGAGGFFIILAAIPSAAYLLRARLTPLARAAVGIPIVLVCCIPIGVLSFGFDVNRVISVAGNVSVWLVLAAGLDAASKAPIRDQLARALVWVGIAQGGLTFIASMIYPARLPLPIIAQYADALPSGPASFARSDLFFRGWLNGETFRSEGMMSNATWAGAFGALALIVAISQFRRGERRWFYALGAATAAVSVYYSLSRSSWLLLAGALGVAAYYVARRNNAMFAVAFANITLALTIAAYVLTGQDIFAEFDEINEGRSGSAISRGAIYSTTLGYIRELMVPLIGYGIKPKEEGLVASVATHSTYLGLTFRAGLIGLVLLLAIVVRLIAQVRAAHNALGAGVLAFVAGWMILADIDAGHLVPLFLLLCVTYAPPEDDSGGPPGDGGPVGAEELLPQPRAGRRERIRADVPVGRARRR